MGVSGYFDRSADEAARRVGVGPRFRDTDPRPLPDEGCLGLAALIPTEGRVSRDPRADGGTPPARREVWTDERIREAFIDDGGLAEYHDPINGAREQRRDAGAIFDTWLAAHDAELLRRDGAR